LSQRLAKRIGTEESEGLPKKGQKRKKLWRTSPCRNGIFAQALLFAKEEPDMQRKRAINVRANAEEKRKLRE
jgi:hypothetical protein